MPRRSYRSAGIAVSRYARTGRSFVFQVNQTSLTDNQPALRSRMIDPSKESRRAERQRLTLEHRARDWRRILREEHPRLSRIVLIPVMGPQEVLNPANNTVIVVGLTTPVRGQECPCENPACGRGEVYVGRASTIRRH